MNFSCHDIKFKNDYLKIDNGVHISNYGTEYWSVMIHLIRNYKGDAISIPMFEP